MDHAQSILQALNASKELSSRGTISNYKNFQSKILLFDNVVIDIILHYSLDVLFIYFINVNWST